MRRFFLLRTVSFQGKPVSGQIQVASLLSQILHLKKKPLYLTHNKLKKYFIICFSSFYIFNCLFYSNKTLPNSRALESPRNDASFCTLGLWSCCPVTVLQRAAKAPFPQWESVFNQATLLRMCKRHAPIALDLVSSLPAFRHWTKSVYTRSLIDFRTAAFWLWWRMNNLVT